MFGVFPAAAGKPALPSPTSPLSRVQTGGAGQLRGLGSHCHTNQGEQFSAARAVLAVGALVLSNIASHRGRPLQGRPSDARESPPEPPAAPSTLDELKLQLENEAIVEPATVARIVSEDMSERFNNHPLISDLKGIHDNKDILPEELKEIEALLIEATREMGFGFPDLCNELWNEDLLEQFNEGIKETRFYELFSSHFREDESHAGKFFKPASEQLSPISLLQYMKDTFAAQPTDRPLIKVFREAMRLGSNPNPNPLALYFIVEALEKSGDPFFSITSKIWPNNPFLGVGHKAKEDGHAQSNSEIEKAFLSASSDQEELLGRLGFSKLRDCNAQLEAIKVGERTRDAMLEYLDGIQKRLKKLRDSQLEKRMSQAESAVSEVEKPQIDTQAPSPTPEQVLIGVKVLNGLVGSYNIMKSVFEIEKNDKNMSPAFKKMLDAGLLDTHETLEAPLIVLSELIENRYPDITDHVINDRKFFTPEGKIERAKVLKCLRTCALAETDQAAKDAISGFYELMIKELGDIQTQLNNDKPSESGELIPTINKQIAEVIKKIGDIKEKIGVLN